MLKRISINKKVAQYLEVLLKMAEIEMDETDKEQYFNKLMEAPIADFIKSVIEDLDKEYRPHLAMTLALYFSLSEKMDDANKYLRIMQQKKIPLLVCNVVRGILICETKTEEEALDYLDNMPLEVRRLAFIQEMQAELLFRKKDYGKAEKFFKQLVGKIDNQIYVYNRLGEIYLIWKKFDQAETMFLTALQFDFNNIVAHFYLGDIYKFTGDIEKAKREYGICAAIDMDNQICILARQRLFDIIEGEKKDQ